MGTLGMKSAVFLGCYFALFGCSGGTSSKLSKDPAAQGGAPDTTSESNGGTSDGGAAYHLGGTNNGGTSAGGVTGSNTSPGCTPQNDTCPTGQYCASVGVCTAGCKIGADCASSVCLADHNCDQCVADTECSTDHVCSTGVCTLPCSATANTCSGTLSCCASHCTNTTIDANNCLGCGLSCQAGAFCGNAGCATTTFGQICAVAQVTGVLAENADDTVDDPQTTVLVNTFGTCSKAPATAFKGQRTGGILNPTTGQPVSRGTLLAVAGGTAFQQLVSYLNGKSQLPVYEVWDWTTETVTVKARSNESTLRQLGFATMTDTRDLIVVQLGLDPLTGTPVLSAYGCDKGTTAAVWYYVNVVKTDTTATTKSWFVCDWTDRGTTGPDAADLWDCTSG